MVIYLWIAVVVVVIFLSGIRIVRPTHRGLIERLGRYNRFAHPGFSWIIPVIETMRQINITEMMVDAAPQEIITNDNLNARVDAQVYFRVKEDEPSVKASQYNVNNFQWQIVNLARTTLRNIIGTLTLKSANSERGKINDELLKTLSAEAARWGIDIVRTELKEIDPPKDVQETMNKVVKAENEKIAAIDFATATETMADGARRAEIKKADAEMQATFKPKQDEMDQWDYYRGLSADDRLLEEMLKRESGVFEAALDFMLRKAEERKIPVLQTPFETTKFSGEYKTISNIQKQGMTKRRKLLWPLTA